MVARERKPSGLDFSRDGKLSSWLVVGTGGRGKPIKLPITIVRNGPGPAVLFIGGNHGDEYEGPIALFKLARELAAEDLTRGTVVIMPALNPPAVAAGTRNSPLDGKNLNRVFPGKAKGSPTERIAHAVTSDVLPHVDTVLDLHAGGRTALFIPSIMIHKRRGRRLMEQTVGLMKAFRAPAGILIKEFDTEGMIDTTVERMGKVFGCCELGGAGMVTPETVDVTETGIRNVLKHLGMMKGRPRTAPWGNRRRTRVLEALSHRHYVRAEADGLFEPLVELADAVEKGQPVGRIHDFKSPGRAAAVYRAPVDGIVFSRRAFGLIGCGDKVALVASETNRW